jgi:hypothetical protein
MAEEQPLRALTEKAYQRLMKVLWWAEAAMREQGIDFGDVVGEYDHEHVPPANYVRVTGSPATGDATHGIYPGQFVSLDGTGGTGPWSDYDPTQFCYVRDLTGAPLMLSSSATAGPIYKGNVYANHGTGALVLVGGGGCTGGTCPTGATTETACQHTLIYDTCNGEVVSRSTLVMNFGVPAKFCLSQSTGPAPPCPTGPTGPAGAGIVTKSRAVPVVVGESVLVGKTTLGSVMDVSVNGGTAFQGSKLYNVAHRYDDSAPTTWREVRPITSFLPYGTGHDFALDVMRNGSEQSYRIRRVAGTTAATASIDFLRGGAVTDLSGTGATAVSGYAPNMVITQVGDAVAVGKTSTDLPTFLLDVGSAGLAATGGVAFNTDSSNVGTRNIRWRRSGSPRFDVVYEAVTDTLFVTDGVSTLYSWWSRTVGFVAPSIYIDSNGGANSVKVSQLANTAGLGVVSMQASGAAQAVTQLELLPQGSSVGETRLRLCNFALRDHSGQLSLSVSGATAFLQSVTSGIGTPVTLFRNEMPTLFTAGITCTTATFSGAVVFNNTVNVNGALTCTASASFTAPVAFTSTGTASFASRAAFTNSFTLESAGGGNPLLFQQTSAGNTFSILTLKPTTGNAVCAVNVLPLGTQDSTQLLLGNGPDISNLGCVRLSVDGATGYMESVTTGTGTPVAIFQWVIPTRFSGNPVTMDVPVNFTSTGTATFAAIVNLEHSFTLVTPGFGGKLKVINVGDFTSAAFRIQPVSGNLRQDLDLLPSGTNDSCQLHLYNGSDSANAGSLRLKAEGATGWMESVTGGTGTVMDRFNWDIDMRFLQDVGFNGTVPIAKPTVTGSRGANAALQSLLTALANYGLVTDSTTA